MELKVIHNKIFEVRGMKVMLDFDLAVLYEVETRVLNQAVKRNISRFPSDFMFQLTEKEWLELNSSQFVMSSTKHRGARYLPFAFTEQGLAMLSGVLNSEKAINVNISIMRAFVFLRQNALLNKDLEVQMKALEKKYDKQFKDVYEALNYLINDKEEQKKEKLSQKIGYKSYTK